MITDPLHAMLRHISRRLALRAIERELRMADESLYMLRDQVRSGRQGILMWKRRRAVLTARAAGLQSTGRLTQHIGARA